MLQVGTKSRELTYKITTHLLQPPRAPERSHQFSELSREFLQSSLAFHLEYFSDSEQYRISVRAFGGVSESPAPLEFQLGVEVEVTALVQPALLVG